MKWPWTPKQVPSPARALSIGDAWSFRHPVDPPLAPRLAVREARDAVYKVVTEMNQRGALDAGNGDVLDAWIDSLRPQWIAHHVMASTDSEAAAQRLWASTRPPLQLPPREPRPGRKSGTTPSAC